MVSKAEGRTRPGDRDDAVLAETDRMVARRGSTAIVRTHHGLVMAAAGVDASNTEPGTVVLLPADPDASARGLRERTCTTTGRNVAVLVTDTAGRAWRQGQTDIAVGAAGLEVLHDYAGAPTPAATSWRSPSPPWPTSWRRPPTWSSASSTSGRPPWCGAWPTWCCRPVSTARGPSPWCGPRPQDMFGLGAREAVLAALREDQARGFGAALLQRRAAGPPRRAGPAAAVDPAVDGADGSVTVALTGPPQARGAQVARLRAAAFALGWRASDDGPKMPMVRLRRRTP